MKKLLLALALLWPLSAGAQNVTNHAVPVGKGHGTTGWGVVGPCTAGQSIIWSSPTTNPACGTPSIVTGLTVGSSPITGGTVNGILFNAPGAVLGNTTSVNSAVLVTDGSGNPSLATTLPSGLTAASFTVTTAFTATGLVTNADLANSATTVNSTSCVLGSTCTVAASGATLTGGTLPSAITIPSPAITGTPTGVGSIITINGTSCALAGTCSITLSGGTLNNLTVTGFFTATGLVTNADLVNSAMTINTQACTLGATCVVTTAANTLTGTALPTTVVGSSLTSLGTIVTGIWNATPIGLTYGGTAAALTASNGGIVYSTASTLAILSGTATAGQCLLSATSTAPTWGSCTGSAAVSSVSNSDSTLTISPTTGAVVASINLANANAWTAKQTFNNNTLAMVGSSTGATTFASLNASATNYTFSFPAVTGTAAILGTQTFTGTETFSGTLNVSGTFQIAGNAMTFPASAATLASLTLADQTVSGGANVTSLALSTGSVQPDCGARPSQHITNGGAFTITAPAAATGSCNLWITNNGSAGVITFSGFTFPTGNTGDPFTVINGNVFVLWIGCDSGVCTYVNKALQ